MPRSEYAVSVGARSVPESESDPALMGALATNSDGYPVGDDEPYAIEQNVDYTIPMHAEGSRTGSAGRS